MSKRQRPAAGLEIVAETEQYVAVKFSNPLYGDSTLIQVYAKPHHDLRFKAFSVGILFLCKRCRKEHCLGWISYFRTLQQEPYTSAYDVLCTEIEDTYMVPAGEPFLPVHPAHLKAYTIYTITDEVQELLTHIYPAVVTSKDVMDG